MSSRWFAGLLASLLIASAPLVQAAEGPAASPVVMSVTPFNNSTGQDDWAHVGEGFADLLIAAFSDHQNLSIVDREELTRVLSEQKRSLTGELSQEDAIEVCQILGADRFVSGGVLLIDGELTVVANVLDVATGIIQLSEKVSGPSEDVEALAIELANQIAVGMEKPFEPGEVDEWADKPIASLHFLRGLGFYHSGQYIKAAQHFALTGDLDPVHPSYRFWLGRCSYMLGDYHHARIDLKRYLDSGPANTLSHSAEADKLLKSSQALHADGDP